MRTFQLFIKRTFDLLSSLLGGVLILPLLVVIVIAIKIDTRGPVLFKQERLGKNGKVFKVLKFRTMVQGAQSMGDGIYVKSNNDNRITKIGGFLRKTSLDELPQLWNVISGDMSLVGPRPPLVNHPYPYKEYNDHQRLRFRMRPGMTGLAQVRYRNSVPWDQRIEVDVEYIEHFSLWKDFKILLQTVRKVFVSESIYMKQNGE